MSEFKIKNTYSFSGLSVLIRTFSDLYSSSFCDRNKAIEYACEMTDGHCLYCGKQLFYENSKGEKIIDKGVHWDHIYPASKFNLFTVGNVALTCDKCNLEKNARDPIQYYLEKKALREPVFIQSKTKFVSFLKKYTKPYRKEFPDFWVFGVEVDLIGLDSLPIIKTLFLKGGNRIDFTIYNGYKYDYRTSANAIFYKNLQEYINSLALADDTKNSMICRIGLVQDTLADLFGENTLIQELTDKDLNKLFFETLLQRPNKKGYSTYKNLFGKIIDYIYQDNEKIKNIKRDIIIPKLKDMPSEYIEHIK